ncbi:hypothetical protein F8M41_005419 [Gigaspora margarita]|uniref:Uncharacterized protein n=1 Tax=Gigaspora margarita TaxID=4874 RepID=A0A8H4AX78_GIGMA|nr:hypothetical protein F8M41_005419 [Gigaspora margarita]
MEVLMPVDANPEFYLYSIGTKTAPDYEVSMITQYRFLSGIARYKRPKDSVQKFALNNLITSIDSSETIESANLVLNMPSTLPKQRFQVPASRLTNLSALSSPKILESPLQLTDPLTLSIPEALAPTIQIASHLILSSPEILKQKLLVNSNLRCLLQPVSNNYVETQELNKIIEIQESQKEFF